jgi:regulatory protein
LARREHSVAELAAKLIDKGCDEALASRVIGDLQRAGLVSDERFSEMLVRVRRARGFGPVRIKGELREKGVAGEMIERRLDVSSPAWVDAARQARQKKFGAGLPKNFTEKARQMRFLQYRGFTHDLIQRAFDGDDA